MAFAGLYEEWLGPDGSEIDSMAIITVPANAAVRPIHDRMPAILPSEHFDAWLDVRAVDTPFAVPLLSPARDDLLEIVEVSRRLNNPRNDGPELLLPDRPALL